MSPRLLDLDTAAREHPGSVVAIGTFDGVHLAHRALLARARQRAGEFGAELLALTFEPHPKEVLLARPPPRITGSVEKTRRLLAAGADAVCQLVFDADVMDMTQPAFVETVLLERLQARACLVGYNFSFGQGGRGRPEDLVELGAARGLEVEVLEALSIEDIPVSSTGIRVLVSCGDVAEAALRLGELHALTGIVVPGDGRGRGLGFPTANLALDPPHLLTPRVGVYAGRAELEGGEEYPALVNVGRVPTFAAAGAGATMPRVEVHMLDRHDEDLYGRSLTVRLGWRVREERRFDGPRQLATQIARDVAELRRRLEEGS